MNKYKTLLTAALFVILMLMTGCSSGDEESTSDAVNNKVVSSQTSAPESNPAVRTVRSQALAQESGSTDKVVNSQVSASVTASVLSDAAVLTITGDDLTKSKGTDQDVIVSLVPTPEQENVPKSTKIEVTFNVPLDVSAIQEHNVKLTYLSSKTNEHITGTISYSETDKKLTFTPSDLLEPGLYEVEIKSLKAEKAYKDVKINEIKYRFVVINVQIPSFSLLSPEGNATLLYSYVTLEVNASRTAQMTAVNQRLVLEQNRTIKIKGVDNNGTYYLYNLPLLQGSNEINITATSEDNVSRSALVNMTSDANGSAPIGMRAGSYEAIGSLQTTVEVGTLLTVSEYLFDNNGNGVIDEINTDGNFTVNYSQEGRYKPRVTIRTINNLLYSSGDFVLSLDVKATADQKDPTGAEPVDVAKEFVQALIANDRGVIERITMNNERLITFIYQDENTRQMAAERTKFIDPNSWQQTYHPGGGATVTAQIDEPQVGRYQIGFELSTTQSYGQNQGRFWFVRTFY
ncbi:MAG: Ig-like domain-containing protein [Campylobacterota bacterium]